MQAVIFSGSRKRIITIISVVLLIIAISLAIAVNTDIGLKYIVSTDLIRYNSNVYNKAADYLSWNSSHIWKPLIYIFLCFIFIQAAVWCRGKIRRAALLFILLGLCTELMLFGWSYNTVGSSDMLFPETPGITMLKT